MCMFTLQGAGERVKMGSHWLCTHFTLEEVGTYTGCGFAPLYIHATTRLLEDRCDPVAQQRSAQKVRYVGEDVHPGNIAGVPNKVRFRSLSLLKSNTYTCRRHYMERGCDNDVCWQCWGGGVEHRSHKVNSPQIWTD